MIIHVGSHNRVKIEAVRTAILQYSFLTNAQGLSMPAQSSVSDQPKSIDETVTGAKNRALNAFPGSKYSIGLESGMIILSQPGVTYYFEHTVCAIYDGSQFYLGFSPAFPLPLKVASLLIEQGLDLEQACVATKLSDNKDLGQAEGIIGCLSKGIVTRLEYTIPAITMALIGLQNQELYIRRT